MFAGDFIVFAEEGGGLAEEFREFEDFFVERDVAHSERGSLGGAAIGHSLDFNETGSTSFCQLGVVLHLLHVPSLYQRHSKHGTLALLG